MRVLTLSDSELWDEAVAALPGCDFYHLAGYHEIARDRGEGEPHLFVYGDRAGTVAIPLLLRSLRDFDAASFDPSEYCDASSVYGYAGPLISTDCPACVLDAFPDAFRAALGERLVVSAFSRLHPLIDQNPALERIGETVNLGETVSIDLELPPDEQFSLFSTNHRRGIRKALRSGFVCEEERSGDGLRAFGAVYRENMKRVGAASSYMFDDAYFDRMLSMPPGVMHLFVCRDSHGRFAAGGVFSMLGGVVQYHLGGTATDFLKAAPMKLVFDTVRKWGIENSARLFHLGGGLGSQEDSLFRFKAGFSSSRHRFKIWRFIVLAEQYAELCAGRGLVAEAGEGFFPAYRQP